MNTPSCRRCGTDKYLKFTSYTPASSREMSFRTGQSTIRRSEPVAPETEFFCQGCGHQDGQSVPADWKKPSETEVPAELVEGGSYWTSPRHHHVLEADGWVIKLGRSQ